VCNPESGREKAFGKALQEFREERDVSQERLGPVAGLERTYISLIERGLRHLIRFLERIGCAGGRFLLVG
jgi:transcriptional regulator with XRE-family HTH domain